MASRVAVGLGAAGAVFAVAQLYLMVVSWSHPQVAAWSPREVAVLQTATGMTFSVVGFLIAIKRRGNGVGWLLLTAGVSALGWWLTSEYAVWGLVVAHGAPGAGAAALLTNRMWAVPAGCVIVMLLVFPTGRLLSRAWWPAVAVAAAAMVLVVPSTVAVWDQRGAGRALVLDEAAASSALGAVVIDVVLAVCLGVGLLTAVGSLVIRWRRSYGVERLQLKWLMLAAAITLTAAVLDPVSRWARVPFVLGMLSIPVAVGIAVLRYRLYEIDRIISRTATYAVISACVVGVYAVVVVLPSVALEVESDLLVAAATLIAAGVFRPVRAWVSGIVDRRFNRSRYDADRTVQGFAAHLRHDTDIDGLIADILHVLDVALQPTGAGLWLRGSGELTPPTRIRPSTALLSRPPRLPAKPGCTGECPAPGGKSSTSLRGEGGAVRGGRVGARAH